MKLLKYTLLLSGLLLAFQAAAQPDTRRMNISIGVFTPSATSYDYEGAIGVVGSTGYTVDDIQPGDMFWDDRSRYQVDSIDIIVAGSSAMVWVTDLYSAGAPQSGKGTLGKPSPNTGVQPLTENGSNFITEAQEAKILTDNLNRLDSLGGDGNGIIDSLPVGNVYVDALGNDFGIYNTSSTYLTGDEVVLGQTWSDYLQVTDDNIYGEVDGSGGSASIDMSSNYIGLRKYKDNTQNNTIGFENDRGIYFTGEESNVAYTYEFPTTSPGANQILTEGATDDNVLEWADMPSGADGNGIYSGEGDIPGYTNAYLDPVEGRLQITNNFSSLSAKFGHDAAANYISLGTFDDTFLKSAILQMSAEKDGSIPPYANLTTINLLSGATSSIELDELSADIISNGIINLTTNSLQVSNYAGTSGYTLPVTSPGNNQLMVWPTTTTPVFTDWFTTSPSVTNITSSGTAQGNIVSSGASSLPSSISQISGVDTAQVNIRAAGGIDLVTTQDVTITSGGNSYTLPNTSPGFLQVLSEGFSNDDVLEWVDQRWLGSELDAGNVIIDGNGNSLTMWLSSFRIENVAGTEIVDFDDDTFSVDVGGVATGFKRFKLEGEEVSLLKFIDGSTSASISITPDNYTRFSGEQSNVAYSYDFPRITPDAADTLKRVMVWEEGASTFELHNGSNYRTLTATGNILPNDDYVELDPSVTSHLPAPSTSFKGKRYTIIAGGGVGGGTPVTIDVVDGSSTIETGASLTIDGAFESYTLVCNGSQWAIISDTTTP